MSKYKIVRPYIPDYVEHHGIIGMHWHEKNGPPYPLSQAEHNSVVKSGKKGGKFGGGSVKDVGRSKTRSKQKQNTKLAKAARDYESLDSKYKSSGKLSRPERKLARIVKRSVTKDDKRTLRKLRKASMAADKNWRKDRANRDFKKKSDAAANEYQRALADTTNRILSNAGATRYTNRDKTRMRYDGQRLVYKVLNKY